MVRDYTTIEETRECFDNMMSWDKSKFACEVQKYSECPSDEELKKDVLETLSDAGYTIHDVINEMSVKEVIESVGGSDVVLEWVEPEDIAKIPNIDEVLKYVDKDILSDVVLQRDGLLSEINKEYKQEVKDNKKEV